MSLRFNLGLDRQYQFAFNALRLRINQAKAALVKYISRAYIPAGIAIMELLRNVGALFYGDR